jgi:8-amino-7-oxononanoate synthase
MRSLDRFAAAKLATLEAQNLRRGLSETARGPGARVERAGRTLVSFSCNDYLGLSQHPEVKRAAVAAVEEFGAGAGASRLVTGDHPLYRRLEDRLARLKGSADAVVFGSGYLANIGIAPALVGPGDLVLLDERAHACMHAAARLSRAEVRTFRHNDLDDLDRRMTRGRCLVMTETVFSMDGDRAPLAAMAALCRRNDAWLLADDAHGFGMIEPDAEVPLQMGTLSKAAGSYGGYLCCSAPVAELMRNRARSFVYTTGLPPAAIGAAVAALDIIAREPSLGAAPLAKARLFCARLGLAAPESAIVPVMLGRPEAALAASEALVERGFLVTAIRPPTVPAGTARLRIAFSAAHRDEDVIGLAEAMQALGLVREAAEAS